MKPRFILGKLFMTPGAMEVVSPKDMGSALRRHSMGDWGDLGLDDKRTNDWALVNEGRLLSAYHTDDGTKFWVITEADRSSTTILLPEEY